MSKSQIYEKYKTKLNLQTVINVSGRMTALGVSTISDATAEAIKFGSQNYTDIKSLYIEAGKYVAGLCKSESALIVNSASAGILGSVSAVIHKGNGRYVFSPKQAVEKDQIPNEIVIPKGQNINYGAPIQTMIEIAGGKVTEAGYGNKCSISDVENQITKNTASLMYVVSHHCVQKSMLTIDEMIEIAKKHKLPLIVDAAAESNIHKYSEKDIDLLIVSGSKAVQGPSSGYVLGPKKYIDFLFAETEGILRGTKIDKGIIFGSINALTEFLNKERIDYSQEQTDRLEKELSKIKNICVRQVADETGRGFNRIEVKITDSKMTMQDLVKKLESGSTGVYTRKHRANEGIVYIDTRPLSENEEEVLVGKFAKAFV